MLANNPFSTAVSSISGAANNLTSGAANAVNGLTSGIGSGVTTVTNGLTGAYPSGIYPAAATAAAYPSGIYPAAATAAAYPSGIYPAAATAAAYPGAVGYPSAAYSAYPAAVNAAYPASAVTYPGVAAIDPPAAVAGAQQSFQTIGGVADAHRPAAIAATTTAAGVGTATAGNPSPYVTYGLLGRRRQRALNRALGINTNAAAVQNKTAVITPTGAGAVTTTAVVANPSSSYPSSSYPSSSYQATNAGCRLPAGNAAAAIYTTAEPSAAAIAAATAGMPLTNAALWAASTEVISASQYVGKALCDCSHKKVKHNLYKAESHLKCANSYLQNIPAAEVLSNQFNLTIAELHQIKRHVPKKHLKEYQSTVIYNFQGQLASLYSQLGTH